MNNKGLKVVFMGTPEFAVASMKAIHKSKHELVGVVTAPDKPAGRGRKLKFSDVKKSALELNIPILQPEKLKNPEFIQELSALNADVFVVVAFRMLPREVWQMPSQGTFNLHGSLLPDYRGAAPIQWAIWNGDEQTGLTTFYINEVIDSGEILLQEKCEITPEDNAGSLHNKLMNIGGPLVVQTLDGIQSGDLHSQVQEITSHSRPAPKIFTEHTYMNPEEDVQLLINQIRALSPFPGARIKVIRNEGQVEDWKILKGSVKQGGTSTAGNLYLKGSELLLSCSNGEISIEELQIPGKKALKTREFLNGWKGELNFQCPLK